MRRKDREMDKEFSLNVIDGSEYGVLSFADEEGNPYALPLSIVRLEDMLYFHSAKSGEKADILKDGQRARVVFVGQVEVPENFTNSQLDELIANKENIGLLTSKVFTTQFESAIVVGKIKVVNDDEEKIMALKAICEKYTPDKMKYFDTALVGGLPITAIYGVTIDEVTGKRKKFDDKGNELKWGKKA